MAHEPSETAVGIVRQGLPRVSRTLTRASSLMDIRAYIDVERNLRKAAVELLDLADRLADTQGRSVR